MMDYMRDGGWGMWLMLVTTVGVGIVAATRKPGARPLVLASGCLLVVIEGMLGMATGMVAVSRYCQQHTGDVGASVAIGLGELANNGTFSAMLAVALGAVAAILHARGADASA